MPNSSGPSDENSGAHQGQTETRWHRTQGQTRTSPQRVKDLLPRSAPMAGTEKFEKSFIQRFLDRAALAMCGRVAVRGAWRGTDHNWLESSARRELC